MEPLEATEFYAGDLVDALKEAGFAGTYVLQTGGGTATIYASRLKEGETDGEIDEVVLGGPGSYHWNDPRKSVFTTDDFHIGEDQYYSDEETEKSWEPYTLTVPSGASIEQMVNLFVKASKEINETARKNPNPNA